MAFDSEGYIPVSGRLRMRIPDRIFCGDPSPYFHVAQFGALCLLAGAILPVFAGCDSKAHFTYNAVFAHRQEQESDAEFTPERKREVGDLLTAFFGTPDEPHVPVLGDVDVAAVMDFNKVAFAAGAVGRDEHQQARGLYREHCAHCHGVTGDGAGPTASFLNPYPRDYRMGVFKFKSTPKGFKPTHEDLKRILMEGVAGTAMPSFKVLPENEVEALIHYVRYLSVRGEVERSLLYYAGTDLDEEDRLLDLSASPEDRAEQAAAARDFVTEVVDKWITSESMATAVPAPDPERNRDDRIALGQALFYGETANCVKCHGSSQLGDGETTDFDDWTKELDPLDSEAVHEYVDLGALKPRNIIPRNLRQGVYRGGRRPVDLFWRIRNGIDGTPMPGALPMPEGAGPEVKGLSDEDLWCLIEYVRSLPFETVSRPALPELKNQRERM